MLDHHESAKTALHGFKCRCGGLLFDLSHSGAYLAWKHFHPETPVPMLISRIEDRDLWKWEYPDSANYLAALDAVGQDFLKWKALLDYSPAQTAAVLARGAAMNDKFQSLCDSIAAQAVPCTLLGHPGWMVNATPEFASDVGARLAKRGNTFGLVWKLEGHDTIKVSLRSVPEFIAGPLAKAFGGGGHPQACAFRLPLAKLSALLDGTLAP